MRSGLFVTFEGTEGTGKSTLLRALHERLQTRNIPALLTREPGGTPLAEKVRELILKEPFGAWAELFLYEAARAEHVERVIRPSLTQGQVVLCDRFTDSTLAYQGVARGLSVATLVTLNRIATQGLVPDLTVWLDLDPAEGLKRAQDPNRFEAEGVEFQKKVRRGYSEARKRSPQRWLTLKVANRSPEELASEVLLKIESLLKKRTPSRVKKAKR